MVCRRSRNLLKEDEIRNWRNNEFRRLDQVVDPVELKVRIAVVNVLDGVLND